MVTATNPYGSTPATSSETAIVGVPPVAESSSPPTISGTTTQGQTLTTTDGVWDSWNDSPDSYAYQWQRCDSAGSNCSDIPGAVASTYTLVYADAGSTIRFVVTATNAYGSTDASSSQVPATGTVIGLPPANTSPPTISGIPGRGQTLTASNGSWDNSPTSYAYQWQRCDGSDVCADISGAASSTYLLVPDDVGATIRVVVTATNPYGPTPATSSETVIVGVPPVNSLPPTISGTDLQGQTLTTTDGAWDNSPTSITYQWQRCDTSGANCSDIPSATANAYTLVYADAGSTIDVVVTATNAYGLGSATSTQTAVVIGLPPSNTSLPTISGTLIQGQTLNHYERRLGQLAHVHHLPVAAL